MFQFEEDRPKPHALALVTRGFLAGLLGVAAIYVWAANFEVALGGKENGGPVWIAVRLILCDAIPLATLITIYRAIGNNQSFDQIVRGIVHSVGRVLTFGASGRTDPEGKEV